MMCSRSHGPAALLAMLVMTCCLAMGCVNVEESENPVSDSLTGLGASSPADMRSRSGELSRHQFDDIPVPEGFFLRNHRNESFSYVYGGRRIGRFVYWGFGKREDIVEHFRINMPKQPYGWASRGDDGRVVGNQMVFEKAGEICRIEWKPIPNQQRDEYEITISVGNTDKS